jgi:REP element-mobilizing transposase RayT
VGFRIQEKSTTGQVAIRVRDILRRIAIENELEITIGKVASDLVHMFITYRPVQNISKVCNGSRVSVHLSFFRNSHICGNSFGVRISGQDVI